MEVRRLLALLASITLLLGVMGCTQDQKVHISYLGVNHTREGVTSVVINGEGGILNVAPMGGGGGVCCVTLPKKWREGLVATIKWQEDGHWMKNESGEFILKNGDKVYVEGAWKEKTVPVPPYSEKDLGHFDIHFWPNDEIAVKVSWIYPHHPDYKPPKP